MKNGSFVRSAQMWEKIRFSTFYYCVGQCGQIEQKLTYEQLSLKSCARAICASFDTISDDNSEMVSNDARLAAFEIYDIDPIRKVLYHAFLAYKYPTFKSR